jgi:hypothetical protein
MANPNLANYMVIPFAAAAATQVAMEMKQDPGVGNSLRVQVESLDDSVVIQADLETSEDGSAWTAVGSTYTVNPRGQVSFAANVGKFFRFKNSGGYGRFIVSLDWPAQELKAM